MTSTEVIARAFRAALAASQRPQQRILQRLVLLLRDEVQHIADRAAARLIRIPAA